MDFGHIFHLSWINYDQSNFVFGLIGAQIVHLIHLKNNCFSLYRR